MDWTVDIQDGALKLSGQFINLQYTVFTQSVFEWLDFVFVVITEMIHINHYKTVLQTIKVCFSLVRSGQCTAQSSGPDVMKSVFGATGPCLMSTHAYTCMPKFGDQTHPNIEAAVLLKPRLLLVSGVPKYGEDRDFVLRYIVSCCVRN